MMVEMGKEEEIWYEVLDTLIDYVQATDNEEMRIVQESLFLRVRVISSDIILVLPFQSFLKVSSSIRPHSPLPARAR